MVLKIDDFLQDCSLTKYFLFYDCHKEKKSFEKLNLITILCIKANIEPKIK